VVGVRREEAAGPSSPQVPVLLITGPVGVGKTTTADAVSYLLAQRGIRHACVDLPQVGKAFPVSDSDPWNEELTHRNLASMWQNFQASGAQRLIVSRVLEARSGLRRITKAVPGAEITVVRLRAPLIVLHRRIRARNPQPEWYLNAATELSHTMELHALEDFVVDNEAMSVDETARVVLDLTGWAERG
jgi:adenylylsulfate kinase